MSELIIIRGGGDIASGVIQKFHRSGFEVVVLEVEKPSFIRRTVCYGEAVYKNEFILEESKAILSHGIDGINRILKGGDIAVVIDPDGKLISKLKPLAVVDAILAKKNLGTTIDMAPITIGLGPGFEAGKDVNVAVETMRGHDLGKLIFSGVAKKNTGIPGMIDGYAQERVIYSKVDGIIKNIKNIGDIIKKDEIIAIIDNIPVKSPITGVLRGLIRDGYRVSYGFKIGDIDPREEEQKNCFTISDKARNIGGSVLEAVLFLKNKDEGSKKIR